MSDMPWTNTQIASVLREIGDCLQERGETPFRVAAYRRAACMLARQPRSVTQLWSEQGEAGLRRLPGIGQSLARTIGRLLRTGRSSKLERLRSQNSGAALLATLPGVGDVLAQRVQSTLGTTALEEVYAAAWDGRLRRVPGVGNKRLRSIRESLATRLQAPPSGLHLPRPGEPDVGELLSIDAQYRQQAASGRLPLAAPRYFNPTGMRWLPILRTHRHDRPYTAHFANTANSRRLGRFGDWVVNTADAKQFANQWTVITGTRGDLAGKRIVVHREADCRRYYQEHRTQQLLPDEAAHN